MVTTSVSYALSVELILVCLIGGGCDDAKKHLHVKTYVSPWEKAMKGDENLIATLKTTMPGPLKQKDLPNWKNFNRYLH